MAFTKQRWKRGGLNYMALIIVLCFSTASTVWGQSAGLKPVQIQAGMLEDSLLEVGRVFGVDIIASGSLIRDVRSPAISGQFSAETAVSALLNGSELSAILEPDGSILIYVQTLQDEESREKTGNHNTVEEVVIIGTKSDSVLQDTAVSVAVFTAAQINDQVLFDAEDILLRTPNVSGGGATLGGLAIRGIGLQGVGNTGTGNTSNVYVDGSPNSLFSNRGAANLWDVAQVEVLRGPQSTTQGRNALAGAMVIQTADPEYEFGADLRALAGNNEQQNYSMMLTGPIVEDQVAFRIAADYRELDFGYTNVNFDEPARFEEALTLRSKLLIEPKVIEGLRIELIGSYTDTEFGDLDEVSASEPAVKVTTNPDQGTYSVDYLPGFFDRFDPRGDITFGAGGFLSIESNEVTRGIADIRFELNDAWEVVFLGTYEDVEGFTDLGGESSRGVFSETFSAEFRAHFDYGRLHGWVGAYYFELDEESDEGLVIGGNLPVVPANSVITSITATSTNTENAAIFGDVTYELSDNWTINLGARLDIEEFNDDGVTSSAESNPADCVIADFIPGLGGTPCTVAVAPDAEPIPASADFDAFLPRGSVTYHFDDDRALAFTIARGYRAGGSFVKGLPGEELSVEEFDPEFITNYEISLRSLWLEGRLRFNANIFYSDWTDQQVFVPGPTATRFDRDIVNVGASELYGVEIDSAYTFSSGLSVFASFGYQKTEFTDFPFAVRQDDAGNLVPVNPDIPDFAFLDGNEFNNAPNLTAAIGLSYEHQSGVFISSNASYADSSFKDIANLDIEKADDLILVNARLGYRYNSFEVSLFGNNIFDEQALAPRLTFLSNATGIPGPLPFATFGTNNPRLWGGELRWSY